MTDVKNRTTYAEQIEKLRSRGCLIRNEAACEDVLKNIGYYRLSAYFLPFKNVDGSYQKDLTFERVYNIYEFDRKLRNLLFAAIEVIEVSFRARIAYSSSFLSTALPLIAIPIIQVV